MNDGMTTREFVAFNTVNMVTACCSDAVLDEVEALCAHFEQLFSHTRADSSLTRVNCSAGAAVEAEPELASLLQAALGYCEASDGLFDISMGPVVRLWDFHQGRVPDASDLESACAHVDWRGVHVDGNRVWLDDSQACVVLGGVAKGYIADVLVALLQERGAHHGCVNLGGNVAVFGGKPDASPWNVGLRVPRSSAEGEEQAFAVVQLANGSVVTSGIYERCFTTPDGSFYHHILDPRTGMPAETDLAAVSLVSERSLDGDGYTTALVVMGLERARAFVEALPDCDAVFVTREGQVYTTSGIGTRIPFRLA